MILWLSACQPLGQTAPDPLTGKAASRLGAAALTLQQKAGSEAFTIVPVSAASGQPVSGAQPVVVGGLEAYGFSTDRSQMAFLSGQSADCSTHCLHLMDLRSWEETITPVVLDNTFGAWYLIPTFFDLRSPRLAVIRNEQSEPASQIFLVDRVQGKVVQQTSLPINIFKAAYTPSGGLALYGSKIDPAGQGKTGITSSAALFLLDGSDLRTLWQHDLEAVHFLVDGSDDYSDPMQGQYLDPAAAFSADGSRLYIAAADRPLLLTVDFNRQRIQQATIQPRASLLDRLMTAGAEPVQAKTFNGIYKNGVLSRDGRIFYVIGQELTGVKNERGEYEMKLRPLGLQMIDTRDGTLITQVETEANDLAISLDGKTLLLHGWQMAAEGDNNQGELNPWTDVLDLESRAVVQHFEGSVYPSRLLNGSLAWLITGREFLPDRPAPVRPTRTAPPASTGGCGRLASSALNLYFLLLGGKATQQ